MILMRCAVAWCVSCRGLHTQVVQTYTVTGSGDVAAWCPSPKGAFVYAIGEDSIMYSFAADSGKLEHMIKVSARVRVAMCARLCCL